jgi:nicotinamidase-related amidase
VLAELGKRAHDYDVPKHRWSAFLGTHLELSLRSRDIDTILLVGGSTHVGIASTAYAARDLDFQVVVVRDGCHGFAEQREFFLDKVFPRMCRVRTVDDVLAALPGGSG